MDDYVPETSAVEAAASGKFPLAIVVCHVGSLCAWMAFAVYDIHKHRHEQVAGSGLPDRLAGATGRMGVTRHVLGTGRACTFVFALFFVLYHLCYENIIHRTDGLEYLSDWTFISLGVTFGFLTAYSLSPNTMSGYPATATFTRIAHSTTWPTNVVSTTGAWYSFVFFPQCFALEGVDNYPWCYLEWYRLCEHGLNMVILFLDWNFGKVPIKRGDFGYSLLFLGTYSAWTMYLQFHTGKCPYVMFDFNSGWASVPWFNAAFVGVSGAFFLSKYLFDRRDLKREEGVGGAVLPVHAKYDAVGERDNTDEYE